MHRVKSGIWVAAYVRRRMGEGLAAVVARKGAEEAGAIFVKINRLDGTADLYGPAPQTAFEGDDVIGRLFERLMAAAPERDVDDKIRREARYDPDLWAVEIEDRAGRAELELTREPRPDPFRDLKRF